MSNYDNILINLILKEKTIDWDELGVTAEMVDADARPVFNFISQHYARYSKLPDRKEVKKNFRSFRLLKGTEPIGYYAAKVRTNYQAAILRSVLADASQAYNTDLTSAIEIFKEGSEQIFKVSGGKTRVVDFGEALKRAPYEIETEHVLAADYPFGDPVLDQELIGMEKGDVALLAGSTASGKSWLLFKLAYTLWRKHKVKILLISLELSSKTVLRRLYAIAARIEYNRFRRGAMTFEEKARFARVAKRGIDNTFEIISAADGEGEENGKIGSLEFIRAKIRKHKPEMLMVDGVYLAMDMDKWGETVAFANGLHMMMQAEKIACIATTQLKNIKDTSNPQLGDLAFTSAFQQAAEFVFLLAKDSKMRQEHYAMLTVGKAREVEDGQKFMLRFNPGADIRLEKMEARINNALMDEYHEECNDVKEKNHGTGGKNKGKRKSLNRSSSSSEESRSPEEVSGRQKERNYLSEEKSKPLSAENY